PIAGLREAADVRAIHSDGRHRDELVDRRRRITRGGKRVDEVAAHVQRHQRERLVTGRLGDASAAEQLCEAGVGREAAVAVRIVVAALAGAIEPSGLAHYGKAERSGADSTKPNNIEAEEFGGGEVSRPVIVVVRPVLAAKAGLNRTASTVRGLELELDPLRRFGAACRRDGDRSAEQCEQQSERTVHLSSPFSKS